MATLVDEELLINSNFSTKMGDDFIFQYQHADAVGC
jgi:hypothetical protein